MEFSDTSRPATNEVRWAIIYSLGWLACAAIALTLTQGEDGIAAVWPSSGIFVAALLHLGERGRRLTSLGVAVASMIANVAAGAGLLAALGYTCANLIEGWLVFLLMDRGRFRHMLLARPANLLRFGISAVVAGLASALMAGVLSGNFEAVFLTSWMSTVTLGMLIVTPVIMFILQDSKPLGGIATLRGFWILVMVILSALAAFGQAEIPLLVLPMVAISITTAALGLSGAVLALLLVTAIGSILTAVGKGPVGVFFPPVEDQVLFFQVYLLALLVSTLPVALSLAQHRRDLEEIATSKKLLEAAERAAKVGHWRHNPATDTIYWSEEAGRLLARTPLPHTLDDMIAMFHPEDQSRVAGLVHAAQANGIAFSFEARIRRFDGTDAHFECRNEVEFGPDNQQPVIFGTIMDVTDRAEAMQQLEKARERAEKETAQARFLAETDHLTGLANRRKILAELGDLVEQARAGTTKLAVAILDVDHFKAINDEHGHETGDRTLVHVAKTLTETLDAPALVGRLGGEEFLAIFAGENAEAALRSCEGIGPRLSSEAGESSGARPVSISIGIAEHRGDWSENQLLRAADEALYEVKRGGRAGCNVYAPVAERAE